MNGNLLHLPLSTEFTGIFVYRTPNSYYNQISSSYHIKVLLNFLETHRTKQYVVWHHQDLQLK